MAEYIQLCDSCGWENETQTERETCPQCGHHVYGFRLLQGENHVYWEGRNIVIQNRYSKAQVHIERADLEELISHLAEKNPDRKG